MTRMVLALLVLLMLMLLMVNGVTITDSAFLAHARWQSSPLYLLARGM